MAVAPQLIHALKVGLAAEAPKQATVSRSAASMATVSLRSRVPSRCLNIEEIAGHATTFRRALFAAETNSQLRGGSPDHFAASGDRPGMPSRNIEGISKVA